MRLLPLTKKWRRYYTAEHQKRRTLCKLACFAVNLNNKNLRQGSIIDTALIESDVFSDDDAWD